MNFGRRLRLFLIGVVLGSVVMYFYFLKDRNIYKTPTEVIKEKLFHNALQLTTLSQCKVDCIKLDTALLRKSWAQSTVDFGASKVHEKPCPIYQIKLDKPVSGISSFECQVCESFNVLINMEADSCKCL